MLEDVPVNPSDASIPMNLITYHDFAPTLRAPQASDRVSVEVICQTVLGRDMGRHTCPSAPSHWGVDWTAAGARQPRARVEAAPRTGPHGLVDSRWRL